MSYITLEVEIENGRVLPKDAQRLPDRASGLLTILHSSEPTAARPAGLAKGQFTVPDDFNAPLPEDVLRGFEGQ